jgi:hypothetical protein
LGHCCGDCGVDFGIGQLRRTIRLQDFDLRTLGVRQILPVAGVELGDRVFALLHHLIDDRQDVGVGHILALVDLALLDRGQQEPDRREPRRLFGAERVFHVVADAGFE